MQLTLKNTPANNQIVLPKAFIERYMPHAPHAFTVIYIYAYSGGQSGKSLSNQAIAEALNILESDVIRAWKYWQEKGLLQYKEDEQLLIFENLLEEPAIAAPLPKPTAPIVVPETKPNYSPEELSVILEKNEAVQQLMASAQSHLGKLLTYSDMSVLLSLYDWLGLPLEVIEILLAYCSDNGHTNMRYIEKTAIDWAENGIDSPDKALKRVSLYHAEFRNIMKANGQGDRLPTPVEEKYIRKWLNEYKLSIDVIVVACEKTILSIGKPNFKYTDTILNSWSKKNVKNVEDVEKLSTAYQQSKKEQPAEKRPPAKVSGQTVKQNRFVNYNQREWDFDTLEKLEREHQQKDLE